MVSNSRRYFALFLPFTVLFLILFGALVTSHGAGLAVPDWPTTFGENMFTYPFEKWTGGIFWEHGHRLIASAVGALMLILAVWVFFTEKRKYLKILAGVSLLAVIVQGIFGGLTVILKLPVWTSSTHAILGQTFFLLTISIAYFHSKEFFRVADTKNPQARSLLKFALIVVAAIYVQLLTGAIMRHSEAGLAIPDFPTMAGSWLPSISEATVTKLNATLASMGLRPVDKFGVLFHLLHRAGAFVVTGLIFTLLYKVSNFKGMLNPKIRRNASILGGLVVLQFLFGVLTVLSKRMPYLTSVHVMLGALLLGMTALLALRLYVLSSNKNLL